jgi:iron-sulfur cluster repair protein YtfE (RIC family)
MGDTVLKIKYQCLHPSCQVFCSRGELTLEKSHLDELLKAFDEEKRFKSPRDICRLGFSQPFKALSIVEESAEGAGASLEDPGNKVATDPLEVLKEEHQGVFKRLELIEEQTRKRDITGLWVSTAAIENDIILSIKKEEEVLFPLLLKKASRELAFIQIFHEDHKEFLSLLHSFRCGLQEDEILDGIVNSLIVNLRNHICKEDEEFFAMIDEHLGQEDRTKILEKMNKVQAEFVPAGAGERSEKIESPYLENRKRLDAGIAHAKHEGIKDDWSCH